MRSDGTRIKNADLMFTIMPYIMVKRYDATNLLTVDIPVEPIQQFRNKLRARGIILSNLAVLVAAYIKTVREYPQLNRFIVNRRIYDRNELCVSMVVLRPGEDGGETMSKVYFDAAEDDIFSVQRKMDDFINESRDVGKENSLDSIMKTLTRVPAFLGIAVGFFKWLDRRGWLPKSVIDASPFHSSLVISNLASIRTNHALHHLYDFGTTSVFMTMGNAREVPIRVNDEIQFQRCMPLGVSTDDRISSGYYFSQAFRKFKHLLENPSLLEEKAVGGEPSPVLRD